MLMLKYGGLVTDYLSSGGAHLKRKQMIARKRIQVSIKPARPPATAKLQKAGFGNQHGLSNCSH